MRMSCSSRQVHPNDHAGDRSPFFSIDEPLNTIYIVSKSSNDGFCTISFVQDDLSLTHVHLNCTPHREGGPLWLLVHRSFHFVAWYSLLYSIMCRDGGYGSLVCGMEEFVEAVWLSIGMCAVGGSNWWMSAWQPHFFVSILFLRLLVLVRVIVWLEYSARCVLGGVLLLSPHQPGGTSVPFACLRCSPLYTMVGIDTLYCMRYMFGVLMTTPHLWSCFACVNFKDCLK